jgi:chromosomal replication initiation ATPase DnaA
MTNSERILKLETAVAELRAMLGLVPGPGPSREIAHRAALHRIIGSIAEHHGFNLRAMTSRDRREAVAQCRHMAMYIARETSGATLQEIGFALSRDHGSVMHGCAAVKNRIDTDRAAKAEAEFWLTQFKPTNGKENGL